MKLVKNAGVTLPDYYIVTNGVKEEVAKIHFSFLLVLVSQIFLTTVIVRYDHMEKYEAQLLIFAAQCCFIWYQIAMFESASRKK